MTEKEKRLAGHMLEADPADIELAEGRLRVAGTDRSVTLAEVCALSPLGVTHLDMPLTLLRIWEAIRERQAGG